MSYPNCDFIFGFPKCASHKIIVSRYLEECDTSASRNATLAKSRIPKKALGRCYLGLNVHKLMMGQRHLSSNLKGVVVKW